MNRPFFDLLAISRKACLSAVAGWQKNNSPYDRYASRAWATKMPALRTKRIAATTSKNMGQPSGTNTGLNTMPSKKPASAAQSKIFEPGALILLPLMIPGNGCRREGDAIFELRLKPQINDRFAPSYFCGFNCGRACGLLYIFASPTNRFGQSRSATASWHAYIQWP